MAAKGHRCAIQTRVPLGANDTTSSKHNILQKEANKAEGPAGDAADTAHVLDLGAGAVIRIAITARVRVVLIAAHSTEIFKNNKH